MDAQESRNRVDIYNRRTRFEQTNTILGDVFPETEQLDSRKIQLIVTRGAMYLLDEGSSGPGQRSVVLSSDRNFAYNAQLESHRIKFGKQGEGVGIQRIFDVAEVHLDAAMAIVLANSYPILREEQIGTVDRELLADYGYMLRKDDEYTLQDGGDDRLVA